MRHRRIGGTDAAAVWAFYEPERLSWLKHVNARDVYERIVNGIRPKQNKQMGRGLKIEPLIREKFVETFGAVEPHPGIIYSEEYEWAASSPDDYFQGDVVVDHKSVSTYARHLWGPGAGEESPVDSRMPGHIRAQMIHNMAIANRPLSIVFTAFGRDLADGSFLIEEFMPYVLRRDEKLEEELLRAEEKFWREHIKKRAAPAIEPLGAIKLQIKRQQKEAVNGAAINREYRQHLGIGEGFDEGTGGDGARI